MPNYSVQLKQSYSKKDIKPEKTEDGLQKETQRVNSSTISQTNSMNYTPEQLLKMIQKVNARVSGPVSQRPRLHGLIHMNLASCGLTDQLGTVLFFFFCM